MKYLSNLYDATFKKNRGKASEGFIRPTLSEFFMSNKDFTEIETETSPILNPESEGFLDETGRTVDAQGEGIWRTSVNTLTTGKYYIEHNALNITDKISIQLLILDTTNNSVLVEVWGYNYLNYKTTNYIVRNDDIVGYRLDIDNKTVDVYVNNAFALTYDWVGGNDGIKLKAGVELHGSSAT
jgi:hypothetical protein